MQNKIAEKAAGNFEIESFCFAAKILNKVHRVLFACHFDIDKPFDRLFTHSLQFGVLKIIDHLYAIGWVHFLLIQCVCECYMRAHVFAVINFMSRWLLLLLLFLSQYNVYNKFHGFMLHRNCLFSIDKACIIDKILNIRTRSLDYWHLLTHIHTHILPRIRTLFLNANL